MRVALATLLSVILMATACGGGEDSQSVSVGPRPTATLIPSPPTATPVVQSGGAEANDAADSPTGDGEATDDATSATATAPPATATATEIPTIPSADSATTQATAVATQTPSVPAPSPEARPLPTATPRPIPTATLPPVANPTPRPTVAPTSPPQQTQPGRIDIGCSISPRRPVAVGELLTFTASQSPASPAVQFAFNHGDGTIDATSVSSAYYAAPGVYTVTLQWSLGGQRGAVPCGSVTVVSQPAPQPQPASGGGLANYLGLPEGTASQRALNAGFQFVRVTRRDTVAMTQPTAYRSDRLNFEVDAGVVTRVFIG